MKKGISNLCFVCSVVAKIFFEFSRLFCYKCKATSLLQDVNNTHEPIFGRFSVFFGLNNFLAMHLKEGLDETSQGDFVGTRPKKNKSSPRCGHYFELPRDKELIPKGKEWDRFV